MTTKKILIKDTLTNTYYCVPMTDTDSNGNLTVGSNDFPFWSADVQEANNFSSELMAQHELNMNDLTESGTRNPIVEVI